MTVCQDCNEKYSIDGYDQYELNPCASACSRPEPVDAKCILYTGIDIPCLVIYSRIDTVYSAFTKIIGAICGDAASTTSTSTTSTSTTTTSTSTSTTTSTTTPVNFILTGSGGDTLINSNGDYLTY